MDDRKISGKPATEDQLYYLAKLGIMVNRPLSRFEASRIISEHAALRRKEPATPRQKARLVQFGQWREGLTVEEASALLERLLGY